MSIIQSRRRFPTMLSMAGAASLVRPPRALAAEGALETTTVRLGKPPAICIAPQFVADELLRAEGFTDIRYVDGPPASTELVARGEVDFDTNYASNFVRGIDPVNDIRWVTSASPPPVELFADGKIDAFLSFPPEPQHLRARHIGRVVVDTTVDPPWSQYFCCVLAGSSGYVRRHPVATKRVLRAILKATDLCATEPESLARRLVDGGFTPRYDYALQSLSELPYDRWRDYDAEDTFRYYALRLHEMAFVKASPQKIIADGTDWRFLNELKPELKA